MKSILDSIKTDGPQIHVLSGSIAGPNMARLSVEVTHSYNSREQPERTLAAILDKTGRTLLPVKNSWRKIDSSAFTDVISGVATINREAVPLTKENRGKFHMYASNMFMDQEQNIWTLKNTDTGNVLIKTNIIEDDAALGELLQSMSSDAFKSTSTSALRKPSPRDIVESGDYVSYVSPKLRSLQYGFVVLAFDNAKKYSELMVLPKEDINASESISKDSVIDVFQVDGEIMRQEEEMTASSRPVSVDDILEYYKKVFRRSPSYFERFSQNVLKHHFA